jgi:NADH:ubiquinone oxidoreductase subunit 5 (subunit L)/multisubunit Na+/H+ antiporter MnhA subunit
LVHSSTLVTAGVYILLRYESAITQETVFILSVISAFTLLISRAAAIFCQDFKKVIALSTLSQLAFIGMVMSLGIPVLAFFHLITHAMFKSCLFMGAGVLLHLAQSNQDIR